MTPPDQTHPSEHPDVAATVLIVTHNRKDELRRAIESSLSQTAPVDVLVFDDASKDGTDEMVRTLFGHNRRVHYVRSEMGRGPIPARNEGMKAAKTDIVFCLDDDAWFTSPDTVAIVLKEFDRPEIGAVQIACWNVVVNEWQATKAQDETRCWVVDFNLEGSNAIRRQAFEQVGGYRGHVRQAEGKDLAIRMLDLGYICRASRAPQINHQPSTKARNMKVIIQRSAQNNLLFAWHNVPMPLVLIHIAGTVTNTMIFGLKKRWLFNSLKGLFKGFVDMASTLSNRRPVRSGTYKLARLIVKRGQVDLENIRSLLPALTPTP